MNCNWCGDEVAEGVWEIHKCKEPKENRECIFCEGTADFLWFDDNGQWFVCSECIKEGKTDAEIAL